MNKVCVKTIHTLPNFEFYFRKTAIRVIFRRHAIMVNVVRRIPEHLQRRSDHISSSMHLGFIYTYVHVFRLCPTAIRSPKTHFYAGCKESICSFTGLQTF